MGQTSKRGDTINPETAFVVALGFERSAKLLSEFAWKTITSSAGPCATPTFAPGLTNLALSLEIYLKCLLALERNGRRFGGHLLYKELYRHVRSDNQALISKYYEEYEDGRSGSAAVLRQLYKAPTFADTLLEAQNAFVAWRYSYEEETIKVLPKGFDSCVAAVRRVILEQKPQWQHHVAAHLH